MTNNSLKNSIGLACLTALALALIACRFGEPKPTYSTGYFVDSIE